MVRKQDKRLEAFTLLELMVVVIIVGISAAVMMPSMAAGLHERRANEAALELVRAAREARSAAHAYQRAHLLSFNGTAGGGLGRMTVYRGVSSGCNTNNWVVITAAECEDTPNCIEDMDMRKHSRSSSTVKLTSMTADPLFLCFQPNGVVMHRRGVLGDGIRFSDRNIDNGGFLFEFRRRSAGVDIGVARQVLIPLGGQARILR